MRSLLARRAAAYGLDIALLFAVLAPAGFVAQRALGVAPSSGPEIYATLVLTFSVPVWAYFALADRSERGATLGKRWLGVRTEAVDGRPVTGRQALVRTAVKMAPWELTHVASFLFVARPGELGALNWAGVGLAYALTFAYAAVAWRTEGRRSVHDAVAGTRVVRTGARVV